MIHRVKDRMDSGEIIADCLVKTLIETREKEKLDWEDTCMLAAVFTLGGVHSVSLNLAFHFHILRSVSRLLVSFSGSWL